jgi:hypothetical protein
MLLKDNGSGDFEQPEAGSYGATCYKLIDLGTQTSEYQGKPIVRRQVLLGWELDEKMTDGRPFTVSQFYTASLNEKAKLRAHLEGWRGKSFTPEELEGFDSKNLLGKTCLISLAKNDKGRVKVSSVAKVPKGMEVPAQINETIYLSLDSFDKAVFEGLSDGIKKIIMQSPEYHSLETVSPAKEEPITVPF